MLARTIAAVRRNHALEHATISILLGRMDQHTRLIGRASPDGFYIYGNVPAEKIGECAAEGLARLKQGESQLAVSPLCGTNLALAGIMAGLASLLAAGKRRRFERLPNVLTAAVLAVVAAQPLGRLVQKHVTTSADLDDLEIVGVTRVGKGLIPRYKVKTVYRGA
ncbi:MAG: DUF6391 domain-containing protein [Dehalococcoidia bacterium]|nr:DUF6391 domain-containing protein [Dehalococcoidia bacterium]